MFILIIITTALTVIELLYKRKTHACGTVRKNRKSLSIALTQAKLKQGETVFCHKKQSFSTDVDGQEGSVHSKWLAQGN